MQLKNPAYFWVLLYINSSFYWELLPWASGFSSLTLFSIPFVVPLVHTPLLSPSCSWGLFFSDCSEIRIGIGTSVLQGFPSQALTASCCKASLAPADRQGTAVAESSSISVATNHPKLVLGREGEDNCRLVGEDICQLAWRSRTARESQLYLQLSVVRKASKSSGWAKPKN